MGPTQSADGTPHIAYYDPENALSFVWSGDGDQPVEVSAGGYGEPVVASFHCIELYLCSVRNFKVVCDRWTRDQAMNAGTSEGGPDGS